MSDGSNDNTAAMNASDLVELMGEFNAVTGRLQESHTALQGEVARLNRELDEANERAQRSRRLAALGEMAAGIAHEVRNPLAAIGLNARLIEGGENVDEESRELARRTGEAVRAVDAIVRDVLSFSRDLRPRVERADALALVERVLEAALAGVVGVEGEEVEVELDRAGLGGLELWCDGGMLSQALLNVVRNALEAIGEVGQSGVLRIGARMDGRFAIIEISDSGTGIDEATLDRMFNPFFTTRASGTGLGLAIVHRIIDAHEGEIAVRSGDRAALGRGTSFEIRVPVLQEKNVDVVGASSSEDEPICTPVTVVKTGLEHAA